MDADPGGRRAAATLATVFGDRWDAQAALDAGLVAAVHPAGELITAAIALGRRLDGQEPVYVKRLIQTVRDSVATPRHADALTAETAAKVWSTTRPAFRAGVAEMAARVRRPAR